ncbi:MAG: hypothetical protein DDT40_01439 [candidate division WS2 bacterium]|nr:hypothetical protein [Candidatus Psychracetigena formicireducens]
MWREHQKPFFRLTPLQLIALCAFGEARGEGREGMHAVINVIHNRRMHPVRRFGDMVIYRETNSAYHAVILRKKQFCVFNFGNLNRPILLRLSDPDVFEKEIINNRALRTAMEVCRELEAGTLRDITLGSDHFHATWMRKPPAWGIMVHRITIGRHIFYSEPPHISESPQVYRPRGLGGVDARGMEMLLPLGLLAGTLLMVHKNKK